MFNKGLVEYSKNIATMLIISPHKVATVTTTMEGFIVNTIMAVVGQMGSKIATTIQD